MIGNTRPARQFSDGTKFSRLEINPGQDSSGFAIGLPLSGRFAYQTEIHRHRDNLDGGLAFAWRHKWYWLPWRYETVRRADDRVAMSEGRYAQALES